MTRLFILVFFPLNLFAQHQYTVSELKNGKFKDDSSYIYTLPFEHKKKVFLVQGYESIFSHKGEKALDFKVKTGTKVCAARDGIVTAVRKDSDKRGLKPENLSDGNYITIQHSDGSDSAFPHLHFEVQGSDAAGNYTQLPTRFYTKKGIIYLRPGEFYRTVHY